MCLRLMSNPAEEVGELRRLAWAASLLELKETAAIRLLWSAPALIRGTGATVNDPTAAETSASMFRHVRRGRWRRHRNPEEQKSGSNDKSRMGGGCHVRPVPRMKAAATTQPPGLSIQTARGLLLGERNFGRRRPRIRSRQQRALAARTSPSARRATCRSRRPRPCRSSARRRSSRRARPGARPRTRSGRERRAAERLGHRRGEAEALQRFALLQFRVGGDHRPPAGG